MMSPMTELQTGKGNYPIHSTRPGTPLVSVIIPNYNHAHYLGDAIRSVLDQEYPNYEILVIDDGSTDNSREVVGKFGSQIRYIWQSNQGLSAARNTGIAASQGTCIGLLDADDIWSPNYLSTMVPVLAADHGIGAVYCGWRYIDSSGSELPRTSIRTVPPEQFYTAFAYMNFLVPSGVLVRRSCFDDLGLFDKRFHACEDRDMWLRISSKYHMVGVPQALVRYRIHGDNMTSNLSRMEESRRAVIAKHFGREEGDPNTWTNLRRRAYGGFYLRTALDHFQIGDIEHGQDHFKQAFVVYPELAENLEAFYELGCANQPSGVRGLAEYLDLEWNTNNLFNSLDAVFHANIPKELQQRRKQAYAYANLAVGLLAYNSQDMNQARKRLLRALCLYPSLALHMQMMTTLLKSLLGVHVINSFKQYRMSWGAGSK